MQKKQQNGNSAMEKYDWERSAIEREKIEKKYGNMRMRF